MNREVRECTGRAALDREKCRCYRSCVPLATLLLLLANNRLSFFRSQDDDPGPRLMSGQFSIVVRTRPRVEDVPQRYRGFSFFLSRSMLFVEFSSHLVYRERQRKRKGERERCCEFARGVRAPLPRFSSTQCLFRLFRDDRAFFFFFLRERGKT